jgi:hypothetical protein
VNETRITWTTVDEIRFIAGLGEYSRKFSHQELIEKYRKTIKDRVVWGDIEKEEVIAYLEGRAQIVKGAGPKGRAYVKLGKEVQS